MSERNSDSNDSKVSVEIKCSIEGDLSKLILIFSLDKGNTWYSVDMIKTDLIYTFTLPDISRGIIILYSFKAVGYDGEESIEDNNGMYYSQIAGQDDVDIDYESKNILEHSEPLPDLNENAIMNTELVDFPPEFAEESKNNEFSQQTNIIEEEKKEIIRPIIPYNPFSPEDGDIGEAPNTFQSFSKIIGAKKTNPPIKRRSFIKRAQIINKKRCSKCKANLQANWRICPICGTKT